jgi:hypothetical protein
MLTSTAYVVMGPTVLSPAIKNTLSICEYNIKYRGHTVTGQQVIQLSIKREVKKQCQKHKLQSQQNLCSIMNENEEHEILQSPIKITKYHLC